MLAKAEAAYFAIADISGYTGFLAAVELRGGRAVSDALDRALPDRAGEIRRVALKPSTSTRRRCSRARFRSCRPAPPSL
jgi:hypothetical protein